VNAVTRNPALALADSWQRDFPLEPRPFARVGEAAELSECEVIELMQSLKDLGILARIGAAVRPNTVGASTLAAMAVPDIRLDEVADLVSGHPAVNHNYEREHDLNLWFVVTAANRAEVTGALDDIARASGIEVHDLPLEQAYHIDLGFSLAGTRSRRPERAPITCEPNVEEVDRALLHALEAGLELVERPYAGLAAQIGLGEADVLARLRSLIERGIVARFGCILRHRPIGYRANAMAVWDVPDEHVDMLGERLARHGEVTLCYRRTRRPPAWPYNLFAMVHGRERDAVAEQIAEAGRNVGLGDFPSSVLFSRRCFKQSAARLAPRIGGAA